MRLTSAYHWGLHCVGKGRTCRPIPITLRDKAVIRLPSGQVAGDRTREQLYHMFRHNDYKPKSFAPNLQNEVEALKARVLRATPRVDAGEMRNFTTWVKRWYNRLFPGFRKQRPCGIDNYLDSSNASPAVKRTIKAAWDELTSNGVGHHSVLTPGMAYRLTKRKSFIKVENDLYHTNRGSLHKAPRLIQGAQPGYIAFVGPMFMTIQAEIKRVWSKKFKVWFTSGAHAKELADYITEPCNFKWFENDVSAYDASIGKELCELELFLARRMGATPIVLQLMRANIHTHGTTSHGIKYRCIGTRKSGDPFTSCYNSVLNGLMHLYVLSAGGNPSVLDGKVKMLVQGDDNIMRHCSTLRPNWTVLLKLGFKCDNIYRRGPMDSEFCSSRLYPVEGGYCFGPKIGRLLNKLLAFNNPPLGVHPHSVAKGVALGLVAVATYVPFLTTIVVRILELTKTYTAYFERGKEWMMSYDAQRADKFRQLEFVDSIYGTDTYLRSLIHEKLARIKFGDIINTPSLNMIFDRDTQGRRDIFA